MFKIITVFPNGDMETDMTYDDYSKAAKRAAAVQDWNGQYGGITMVWNTAVKIHKKNNMGGL